MTQRAAQAKYEEHRAEPKYDQRGTCDVCHRPDVLVELTGHPTKPELLACVDQLTCVLQWRANEQTTT